MDHPSASKQPRYVPAIAQNPLSSHGSPPTHDSAPMELPKQHSKNPSAYAEPRVQVPLQPTEASELPNAIGNQTGELVGGLPTMMKETKYSNKDLKVMRNGDGSWEDGEDAPRETDMEVGILDTEAVSKKPMQPGNDLPDALAAEESPTGINSGDEANGNVRCVEISENPSNIINECERQIIHHRKGCEEHQIQHWELQVFMEKVLAQFKETMKEKDGLQAEKRKMQAQFKKAVREKDDLDTHYKEMQAQFKGIMEENDDLHAQKNEIQAINKAFRTGQTELQTDNKGMQAKIDELQTKNTERQEKYGSLQTRFNASEATNKEHRRKIEDFQAFKERLYGRIKELEVENQMIKDLQATNERLNDKIKELEATKLENRRKIKNFQVFNKRLCGRIEELGAENQMIKDHLAVLNVEVHTTKQQSEAKVEELCGEIERGNNFSWEDLSWLFCALVPGVGTMLICSLLCVKVCYWLNEEWARDLFGS
ncbi:MAG: hypothetical protein Q9219_001858 [cf. Caloplaca sp. 3 TL-2023]